MLETALRIQLRMAGQVHFAVFADDVPLFVDQNLSVEMLAVGRQFTIPK